jgi:thioredoxin 1
MGQNTIEITSKQQLNEILAKNSNVIVDFYAEWCGPCKQLSPVLDLIASEHANVKVCKVNVDANAELSVDYSISSIPAVYFFKDDNKVYNTKGFMGKKQIEGLITTHFGS